MEIIRLEEAKEYCDKHNIERNEWVVGAIDKVLSGTHMVQYRHEKRYLVTIDIEYINSHMQSLKGWDNAVNKALRTNDLTYLKAKQRAQAGQTIGELANDYEIGVA